MTLMTGDEKHGSSATSTLDVLWVFYDRVLRVDPEDPTDESRDRFLFSKGHGPMAYYAVLAAKGFIPVDILQTFGRHDSILGQHPDRTLIPGVEIASGSLGHGLPIALGMSAALPRLHTPGRLLRTTKRFGYRCDRNRRRPEP
jgi:transketolase